MEKKVSRGFENLIALEEAVRYVSTLEVDSTAAEEIEIWEALGRVTHENVVANKNVPPFSRAAMDGYAVDANDTKGASPENPQVLQVRGGIEAGKTFEGSLKSGEAVAVSTGAIIPDGANAVVRVEYAERQKGYVTIYKAVPPGKDISGKGEDVAEGETILRKGRRLTPYDLSLLTSLRQFKVKVKKPPLVGLLACGDELVDPKDLSKHHGKVPAGKIVESNGVMITGLIRRAGGQPIDFGIVNDDEQEIRHGLLESLKHTDLLITIGGTSVGMKDLVPQAIANIEGSRIHFHGINAMPGKPLLLATIRKTPVLSLPGYPVSAAIDFLLFGKPLIKRSLGVEDLRVGCTIPATLERRVPSKPGTVHFVRVSLRREGHTVYASPMRTHGAGILTSLVKADGFLIVPKDREGVERGELVNIVEIDSITGDMVKHVTTE